MIDRRFPHQRWLLIVLTLALSACGGAPHGPAGGAGSDTPAPRGDLTVFAAASLTDAFTVIGAEFSKVYPRVTVRFHFAASTALRTQLEQGARADVFAAADQAQMDLARNAGVLAGADHIFAKNKLVVIYPTSNPGAIAALHDLARPGLKLVLTDKHVPIGAYARTALARLSADPRYGPDFSPRVLANLRSEEANARAAVTKVQLGEADAAIVYASDVTPAVAAAVRALPIPDAVNTIAAYPLAVAQGAPNAAAAHAFVAFVRSPAGQAILQQWGFITDGDTGVTSAPPTAAAPARTLRWRPEPAAAHVTMLDDEYAPDTLTVTAGARVIWTNAGRHPHNAYALRGEFNTARLRTGDSEGLLFTEPGVYHYQCTIHWSMAGTVVVLPAEPTEETT